MTAVISILNKSAVALAADSAVTISGNNGRKIFNTANKIFTLSKYHPVGIMIYSSASLMSTPWETIIKIYRQKLIDKSFPTIKDYQNDFVEFLRGSHYFTTIETQKIYFESLVQMTIKEVNKKTWSVLEKETKKSIESLSDDSEFLKIFIQKITDTLNDSKNEGDLCEDFKSYSFEDFYSFSHEVIKKALKEIFSDYLTDDLTAAANQYFYQFIRSTNFNLGSTGLVFAGFGDNEIYPSICSIEVGEIFDNKIRYLFKDEDKISDDCDGIIIPYAQIDVIKTIIEGINPYLEQTYIQTFADFMYKYNEQIIDIIEGTNTDLATKLKNLNIENIVTKIAESLQKVKIEDHINPTVETVATLSKEDLAEMAESMIYLTYLKRRISFAEESVGGPVDVALISKTDGFIWIKRKHYFKPELNQHFITNYFN